MVNSKQDPEAAFDSAAQMLYFSILRIEDEWYYRQAAGLLTGMAAADYDFADRVFCQAWEYVKDEGRDMGKVWFLLVDLMENYDVHFTHPEQRT